MPYIAVPNSGQSLGATRDQIRNNIGDLKSSLAVNHIDLDNGAQTGKHKFLQLPNQAVAPSTLVNESGFYAKSSTGSQLFWRAENNGTEVQLTKTPMADVNAANGGGSTTRYTFLPGNYLEITGFATNATDGSTINLSTSLSQIISIHLTALGNSSSGTNRALVAQPRTVNAGAGTMVINLQDVNNNHQAAARTVYFTVVGRT